MDIEALSTGTRQVCQSLPRHLMITMLVPSTAYSIIHAVTKLGDPEATTSHTVDKLAITPYQLHYVQ